MGHRNARLTVYGRRLIVQRVRIEGMPVAHVAKAMGISRQCAHRWVSRFDTEGDAGLEDRSSRPHRSRTGPRRGRNRVVTARRQVGLGQTGSLTTWVAGPDDQPDPAPPPRAVSLRV